MGRNLTVKEEGTVVEGAAGSIDFVGASVAATGAADHGVVVTLGQAAFVADPAGGGTVDAQSRTAIGAIIDALVAAGLMAAS
jgi:hypothetical protein